MGVLMIGGPYWGASAWGGSRGLTLQPSCPKQVSNGDLSEAVAFLTEKNGKVAPQDDAAAAAYYQTAQGGASERYMSVGSQADTSRYPAGSDGSAKAGCLARAVWTGQGVSLFAPEVVGSNLGGCCC